MKGKRIAFGDIVGVETVSFDENELGVKTDVVPCYVVGGTEDGYILKYVDKNGLEQYTVSKDILQIRPTREWAEDNGFKNIYDTVWCFTDGEPVSEESKVNQVYICFGELEEKIVGDGPLSGMSIYESFAASTVQEVFSLLGIEKEFSLAGL